MVDHTAEVSIKTFEEFLREALMPCAHQRKGQKLINMLSKHRPDLYERIMSDPSADGAVFLEGSPVNCFYEDAKIWPAIIWIRDNWRVSRMGRFVSDGSDVEVTGGPTKCSCGKPKITTIKQIDRSWCISSWCGCSWGEEPRWFETRKEAEHALYENL